MYTGGEGLESELDHLEGVEGEAIVVEGAIVEEEAMVVVEVIVEEASVVEVAPQEL